MTSMKAHEPSQPFRLVFLAITGVVWLFGAWLATHRSEQPQILGSYSQEYFLLICVITGCALALSGFYFSPVLDYLYRHRLPITTTGLSFVTVLFLSEMLVRILDPLGISYYHWSRIYQLDRIADQLLVFRHRSSWQTEYEDVPVRFNEFGLRGAPIPPKSKEEFRILVLGDSVTLGLGVKEEDIYPTKLGGLLAQQWHRPVRTINAGVGGYNTVQEVRYLIKEGMAFEPDMVILLYVMNDVEVNEGLYDPWSTVSLRGKSPPEILAILVKKSWIYRLTHHVLTHRNAGQDSSGSLESARQSQGWKASMEALKQAAAVCEAQQIPLITFFFRWEQNAYGDALLEDVRQAEFPGNVIDIKDWFRGKSLAQYFKSEVDSHPNARGHQILAEEMAHAIEPALIGRSH